MEHVSSRVELTASPVTPTAQDQQEKLAAQWEEIRWQRPFIWSVFALLGAIWLVDNVLRFRRDWDHLNFFSYFHLFAGALQASVPLMLYLMQRARSRPRRRAPETPENQAASWYKPQGTCDYTFAFDDEALNRTDDYGSVTLPWQRVKKIVAAPSGLLFYYGLWRHRSFWLPERIFDASDAREAILRHAAAHGVKIQEIRT